MKCIRRNAKKQIIIDVRYSGYSAFDTVNMYSELVEGYISKGSGYGFTVLKQAALKL